MIVKLLNSQMFSIFITLFSIYAMSKVANRFKTPLLNPLVTAGMLLMLFISISPLSIETYYNHTAILRFFVSLLTVSFAIPLYKNIKIIGKKWHLFVIGTTVSIISTLGTTVLMCNYFGITKQITSSLLSKNLTTPFALDVSSFLGGLAPLAVAAVVLSGITGAVAAPVIFKIFKIKSAIAQGFSMGSVSHVLGSVSIAHKGELHLASASIAITMVGFFSALLIKLTI